MDSVLENYLARLRAAGLEFRVADDLQRRADAIGLGGREEERSDRVAWEGVGELRERAFPGARVGADHASHDVAAALARRASDLRGRRLLELGCGSGMVAVVAARLGAEVTAVDLDERAVRLTLENARANEVALEVRQGDLLEPVLEGASFDWIVANLPHKPGVGAEGLPLAQAGGEDGAEVWERALPGIERLAPPGARLVFFMHSLPAPRLLRRIATTFALELVAWKLRRLEVDEYEGLRERFRARHEAGTSYLHHDDVGEALVAATWIGVRR
ncbi:MAG: 50S ribosomal protein L11 methyltransferase [Planctomycetota bacterium]